MLRDGAVASTVYTPRARKGERTARCQQEHVVIPAKAGLRRLDAEANIREANGPEGEPRMRRVIHFDLRQSKQ
jgi:hypothetical protein